MRHAWGVLLILCVSVYLSACDRAQIHQARFFTLGTLVDASVYTADRAQAKLAFAIIEAELDHLHNTWHAWEPGPLATLNAHIANMTPAPVDAQMVEPLQQAMKLYQLSDGLFNPAMGHLIALWGFHSQDPQGPIPHQADIDALLAHAPSMHDLELTNNLLTSTNTHVKLDLGAFIKGYGIDQIIARLRAEGIEHAIVNAGGDLRAIGQPGKRHWRIGIRHPDGVGVMAGLEVKNDASVFTSGDYERYYLYAGQRYHHLLDPRTGYPANTTRSVTVVHASAAYADAATTALFVAGPAKWREMANTLGLEYVMLIDQNHRIHLTSAMAERLTLLLEHAEVIIVD